MPNYCANAVTIEHDNAAAVKKVIDAFLNAELCETFLPIRQLPTNEQYNAAIQVWGTKWDVGNVSQRVTESNGGKRVFLGFESAWTPPLGLYDELVRLGYRVNGTYFEPGVGFVGEYQDGLDQYYEFDVDNIDQVVPEHLVNEYDIHDWFDAPECDEECEQ